MSPITMIQIFWTRDYILFLKRNKDVDSFVTELRYAGMTRMPPSTTVSKFKPRIIKLKGTKQLKQHARLTVTLCI